MSRRLTKYVCTGYTLHFFDAGLGQRGSDKFYRAFIYEKDSLWVVVMCWGRDGTLGQSKVQSFRSLRDAENLINKKRVEKMRHGYEQIGTGSVMLDITRTAIAIGEEFADAVAQREPDKTRMSGGIIIQEEPGVEDLMDLLG